MPICRGGVLVDELELCSEMVRETDTTCSTTSKFLRLFNKTIFSVFFFYLRPKLNTSNLTKSRRAYPYNHLTRQCIRPGEQKTQALFRFYILFFYTQHDIRLNVLETYYLICLFVTLLEINIYNITHENLFDEFSL